ncbi:MAG: preprotein translocase subunit YajC [Sphingobium sp.]
MLISPAFAQTAASSVAGASGTASMLVQVLPLVLIFGVFWLLIIRPQSQRMKQHKAKLDAVKKGDQVVTGGGLLGKVTKVEDGVLEIELGANIKVKALKSTLTDVVDAASAKPAND